MDGEIQYLAVTSALPKPFSAKFHGVEYRFKPGKPVNMPVAAVEHVFGFGVDDKTAALHRLGWLTLTNDTEAALEKLAQVSCVPIEQVFEISKGPRSRRRARALPAPEISNDRSPVNADESEGEGSDSPDESIEDGEAASGEF
jgi:hypothetical protein